MASPTFTLLNHQLLTTADTNTGWNDLTTADTDIKVEGSNSMSGIFRADGEQGYYDSGTAPVTGANKTFRGWILTNNLPYMGTEAVDPYKLLMFDGSTTQLKTLFGSDTYEGGWFNIVWDVNDFTTLTLANIRRWGVESGHATNAKNLVNTWMDVMRYLDGYSMTGGTSGDKVTLATIAASDKTSAYGVLTAINGVYFATGAIQFGTGATTHYFEMDGQVLVFIDKPVSATLYKLVGVGSGTNIIIKNSVLRATTTATRNRFDMDFDDTNLASFEMTANTIVRSGPSFFKNGQTVTGNIFDDCGQINAAGANLSGCVVKNYSGTADTSALIWNVASDPGGELDDIEFTKGSTATHAIEFGLSSPTTMNLSGITFSGYNASNAQNDSALYFARTTGTVTVNLSGMTTPSYKSAGATIVFVNAVTVTLTGLPTGVEVRVYNDTGSGVAGTEIDGIEDTITNSFSFATSGGTPVIITIFDESYDPVRILYTVPGSDASIPIQMITDGVYLNP